jgi:hypothetical protein
MHNGHQPMFAAPRMRLGSLEQLAETFEPSGVAGSSQPNVRESAMVHIRFAPIGVALVALLTACGDGNKSSAPPATALPAPTSGAPSAPTVDPSLPPIPSARTPATDASARGIDSAATKPMDSMSKKEESEAMPKAGQGNSHSSPSLEPKNK